MYRLLAAHARGAGAARSAPASRLRRPGAAGPPPQRAVELGHHQAARARRSGPTSTCTSCSTSSAATSSAGWWPIGESATLAERFIDETCARQGIGREQLTIHADRGPAMTSKPVAFLLADLGVTKTHSPAARLQRQPVLGGAVQDAQVPAGLPGRASARSRTPAPTATTSSPGTTPSTTTAASACSRPHDVHFGLAEQRVAARATVLATAYAAHPERFPRGLPRPQARPEAVWINPPKPPAAEETRGSRQLAAVSLTTRDPGRYSRPTVPTLTDEAALEAPA